MNKRILFFLLSLTCLIVSCKEDDTISPTPGPNEIVDPTDTITYVDLGLESGTLWAVYNLGTNVPEGYGDYFAWGETQPKKTYWWDSYKWGDCSEQTPDRYICYSYNENYDHRELFPEDDAAIAQWGEHWRMPTRVELMELTQCQWRKLVKNGVFGHEAIGPNGNTIFFPATGMIIDDELVNTEQLGYYWSTTLNITSRSIYYCTGDPIWGWTYDINRCIGMPIRAVRAEKKMHDEMEGDYSILERYIQEAKSLLTATFYSEESMNALRQAYDEAVAFKGSTKIQKFINEKAVALKLAINGLVRVGLPIDMTPIDLGLSVLWAPCNLGAIEPEDVGDYYSWGEVQPKVDYSHHNYKWLDGDDYDFGYTKYVNHEKLGLFDGKTQLDPEDDAAQVQWGDGWRMPTREEWQELMEKSKLEFVYRRGEIATLITGPNGHSMLLPVTGFGAGQNPNFYVVGTTNYWSSTLYQYSSRFAYQLDLDYTTMLAPEKCWQIVYQDRFHGLCIRPVKDKH